MKTVLTTWGCVGVGDVVCPAPGAEWEVIEAEPSSAGTVRIRVQRGDDVSTNTLPIDRPVYILDKVTAAAERDGVDPAEVAAGVLTSGGLAPETVTPPGQAGAAILWQCPTCFALTYPSRQEAHEYWHTSRGEAL